MGNLTDYEALMNTATEKNLQYEKNPTKDSNIEPDLTDGMEMRKDDLFSKGLILSNISSLTHTFMYVLLDVVNVR